MLPWLANPLSRRRFLTGSVRTAVAVIVAEPLFLLSRSQETVAGSASTILLYGLGSSNPAVRGSVFSVGEEAAVGLLDAIPLAFDLSTPPLVSPDGATAALITVDEASAVLSVSFLSSGTGSVTATSSVPLKLAAGSRVLATPTFSSDSKTLFIVLSITEPVGVSSGVKRNQTAGTVIPKVGTRWQSRHEVVGVRTDATTFGPYSLDDAPSLALVDCVATSDRIVIWTVDALPFQPTDPRAVTTPRVNLTVVPADGQNTETVDGGTYWPVNSDPTAAISDQSVIRVVQGRYVELVDVENLSIRTIEVEGLDISSAKNPGHTVEVLGSGEIHVATPGAGRSVFLNPRNDFAISASYSYPPPRFGIGGPSRKTVLSEGTLFVLGGPAGGGIAAYDLDTGRPSRSFQNGQDYSGLRQLSGGNLLAVSPTSPRVSIMDHELKLLGTYDVPLDITALP